MGRCAMGDSITRFSDSSGPVPRGSVPTRWSFSGDEPDDHVVGLFRGQENPQIDRLPVNVTRGGDIAMPPFRDPFWEWWLCHGVPSSAENEQSRETRADDERADQQAEANGDDDQGR